jgi:hypothetical protein
MDDTYKVCFVIALKYYRTYESFIKYYVDNIQRLYKNSFIIIVDNNSRYIDDIKQMFIKYTNLIIITNDTICKFEIGAYKVGINYLILNNLLDNYNYYIFTQDNFILKNKYDFNILSNNNTVACPIVSCYNNAYRLKVGHWDKPITQQVLTYLNLQNSVEKLTFCWCSSFILEKSVLIPFLNITQNIVITIRHQSESSERYLSGILYYLNNYIHADIDGDMDDLYKGYDSIKVNLYDNIDRHFVKRNQQKNEHTQDI